MEERVKKWIQSNLDLGYTPQQIRESLSKSGYDPYLVDEYLGDTTKIRHSLYHITKSDTANLFAFIFTMSSLLIMMLSPFLAWINYNTVLGDGEIKGRQTNFGMALLFVSTSSLILSLASKFLNRNFAIGIIFLSIFAIGILVITLFAKEGIVTSVANVSLVKGTGTTVSYTLETAFGIYIAFLSSIMSLVGGMLSVSKEGFKFLYRHT